MSGLAEAEGQRLLSHSQLSACRFLALSSNFIPSLSLAMGISLPHTQAWHQTPPQPLAAVTSRMLTWRNAWKKTCSLWLEKKDKEKDTLLQTSLGTPSSVAFPGAGLGSTDQAAAAEGRQQPNNLH